MTNTPRCYTVVQLLEVLQLARGSFNDLKRRGKLPFLEELQPRLGRHARYRAAPVDLYLDNLHGRSRSFSSHRRAS